MIAAATEELGLLNDDQLSDTLSSKLHTGLMILSNSLGEICGPVLGGLLVQVYGYQVAFSVMSAISISVFLVYLGFSCKQRLLPEVELVKLQLTQ
jgi:MFS family permease